jgi:midasin (ATPase involved in ribosome maturation)
MARGKMSIPSSSDDSSSDDGEGEGKPSLDELAKAVKCFEDVCTKQKDQLKTLKNKFTSSQNDYKCLLEKFETFANLNCELTTKIEKLESITPSLATNDRCWELVLKCYELRTRQHKMLNVNALRPLKHYFP